MPRYFFDIIAAGAVFRDDGGMVLSDLQLAHQHAVQLVCGTYSLLGRDNLWDWRVEIRGVSAEISLTIPFPFFRRSREQPHVIEACPGALASARLFELWLAKRQTEAHPELRRG
ncbi:MAG: DUF6894 family protein [Pannonibacter sp.]